jgi:hypothetical protein
LKNLAIYGAGGFGRETVLLVGQINATNPTWKRDGFYDDGMKRHAMGNDFRVLGPVEELNALKSDPDVALAIADSSVRQQFSDGFDRHGCRDPDDLAIGDRRGVGAGAVVTKDFPGDVTLIAMPANVLNKK